MDWKYCWSHWEKIDGTANRIALLAKNSTHNRLGKTGGKVHPTSPSTKGCDIGNWIFKVRDIICLLLLFYVCLVCFPRT